MHRVSPKLSDLQMSETSNFPFRLESIVHLPHLSLLSAESSKCIWDWRQVISLPSRDRVSFVSQFCPNSFTSSILELFYLVLQILSVHRILDKCLRKTSWELSQALWSQALWAHNLWENVVRRFPPLCRLSRQSGS